MLIEFLDKLFFFECVVNLISSEFFGFCFGSGYVGFNMEVFFFGVGIGWVDRGSSLCLFKVGSVIGIFWLGIWYGV